MVRKKGEKQEPPEEEEQPAKRAIQQHLEGIPANASEPIPALSDAAISYFDAVKVRMSATDKETKKRLTLIERAKEHGLGPGSVYRDIDRSVQITIPEQEIPKPKVEMLSDEQVREFRKVRQVQEVREKGREDQDTTAVGEIPKTH